jgi:molybdenum cofactor synthesis domain-containing protein
MEPSHEQEHRRISVGILTISDKASAGQRDDRGGPAIRELVEAAGMQVAEYQVVPDEQQAIAALMTELADRRDLDLLLSTGGTGLAPRDVTPQATLAVIDYQVPGIAETMRAASLAKTPAAMLSRAVAGVRRRTLIVNLPGSPKGVRECIEAIMPALPHAISTLRAEVGDHDAPRRAS